jgi:hypothetical protein
VENDVAEEIGWTGFLQYRLQAQYGPLKACVLVEIALRCSMCPMCWSTPPGSSPRLC